MASPLDRAGRTIAGLIGYDPGPGIYSRLERAVQGMPANVRVEELPGLLKRYKDGVPGWELKAADLDSVIAGRSVVPRDELLSAVRERSPVYTHGEVILGGRPQIQHVPPSSAPDSYYDSDTGEVMRLLNPAQPRPDFQFSDTGDVSRIGEGVSHGDPRYSAYGQGGQDYAELLLTQPNLRGDYGSHWDSDTKGVVAHARYDTHGDALRINELQSDLGIHNRKMRESAGDTPQGSEYYPALPFPLEDAWSDLLIKRLALEAARGGHRAIEIASPRAIADKVGGNIENYEHFYGKVVPGAIERLGRKMGGMVDESASIATPAGTPESRWTASTQRLRDEIDGYERQSGLANVSAERAYRELVNQFEGGRAIYPESQRLYHLLMRNEGLMADEAAERMAELMSLAERQARATAEYRVHNHQGLQYGASRTQPPGRRYIMSDEMRKRILTQGIGASLLAPIAMEE
jgi:hypothetical protein